jgi:phage gp16-like protein
MEEIQMPTKNQIIKIHALKGSLKLDDDTYRAILDGYGVKTSTKLTIVKADQLIDDLVKKATAAGVWEKRKPAVKAKARTLADDDQSRMIRGIWIELHQMGTVKDPSEKALAAYVKRMTKVAALQWLDVKQAQLVIEALKKWRKRIEDGKA